MGTQNVEGNAVPTPTKGLATEAGDERNAGQHATDESTDGDVLSGGDVSKAPRSLAETEHHPIEGTSSGHSWDDPDEL